MCMIVWLLQRGSCCCSSCCYVRGICTLRTVFFSVSISALFSLSLFVANCFQRKLLHAQSYEQTDRGVQEGQQGLQGSRGSWQYMYVYRSGWQAFAQHWLCKQQTACGMWKTQNFSPMRQSELRKDQAEPPNGSMQCRWLPRELLALCRLEFNRQFMCVFRKFMIQ